MTTMLLIAAVALLIWQNKKLADQIRAITARQDEAEQSISRLSRKTRKATVQQRKFDERLQRQRQKQERLAKQQQQIKQEQRKQSEQISKLQFTVTQADATITATQERLSMLFALLDIAQNHQAAAFPGSKDDVRYSKQILSLHSQIHTAEQRLSKAEFNKSEASRKLAA